MARQTFSLNRDWLYAGSDIDGGESVSLDESVFTPVLLPHANTILNEHCADDFQNQIESYRFVSWYRRHINLGGISGKRIYIEFEGVATVADVYVNGIHAGTHKGAYTGFTLDITDMVAADGSDNVIAVRVDSTKHPDIPPEGGNVDYCLFGGIVRNVNMIFADTLHISDVFVSTPDIGNGSSVVNIEASVLSCRPESADITVKAEILDGGRVVSMSTAAVLSEAGKEVKAVIKTPGFDGVKLWDTGAPNLYTARLSVICGSEVIDEVSVKFGFRWYEFSNTDSESRLYLNGRELVIRGINRHEQWPWIGRAANDRLQAEDADLIKKNGINTVRCSHYPQSRAFLDRCDEIGLIVFEEAPGWQHIGDAGWQEIYLENVAEMIKRDKNHPSIMTWGVRVNESQDCHELYEKSNCLAHGMDPTRPTHGVRMAETYNDSEFQEDIFCANYSYPEKPRFTPFVITEHSYDWTSGDGRPEASDEMAINFVKSFAEPMNYYYSNRLCAGGIGWSMFDYNNEVNYTRTGHLFFSGIYDIFRCEKPVAYLYRSQKSPEEETVLYIVNRWTKSPEGGLTRVMVLSNCEEAELFVNGRPAGRIRPNAYTALPHPVFVFEDVPFERGELKAVGYIGGKAVAEFVRRTPEAPKKLVLKPVSRELCTDCQDFTMVIVEITDEAGTVVPDFNGEITVSVSGGGRYAGDKIIRLEGGHSGFIAMADCTKEGKKEIICRAEASAEGIEPAECVIKIKD